LIRDFTRVFDPLRRKEFYEAKEIVKDISTGNVLQPAFTALALFNEDLSGWDVSKATSLFGMFARAESFEGKGLEKWNVSYVRDFSYMFYGATSFDVNISTWDTSRGNNMTSMFHLAAKFNGDLPNWETSRVKAMDSMFSNALKFEGGQSLSKWNVFNVKSMASMFEGAGSFNGNVSLWDTSKVEDMSNMV
jgi:surface protein